MRAFSRPKAYIASMESTHTPGSAPARARGGLARAARLSPEQRQDMAKKAALARWTKDLPQAVCGSPDQPLRIGNVEIQCYVLEDGTRVLSQAGFLEALGRHPK